MSLTRAKRRQVRAPEAGAAGQDGLAQPALAAPPASAPDAETVRMLSASAGNAAVTRWLARQPAPPAPAPPAGKLGDADQGRLDQAIDDHLVIADVERAQAELDQAVDDDEADFWTGVLNDVLARAFHMRCALILMEASPKTTAELDALLDDVGTIADVEAQTLARAGDRHLLDTAWAFPATWAERVEATLKPPADLELQDATAAEQVALAQLDEIAARMPDYIYANGLPVPFAQAMFLKDFPLAAALATRDSTHIVRVYADETRAMVAARVRADMARGWQVGKRSLVDDIAGGKRLVDVATWDRATVPRAQPTLDQLIGTAVAEDVAVLEEMAFKETVDVWRFELALAKVAGYVRPVYVAGAGNFVALKFALALKSADAKIAAADEDERLRLADVWGDANGYPSAARDVILNALIDNVDEMVVDLAVDIGISAIPVVGWIWAAKEIVEEVTDLYDAADALLDARRTVQQAASVTSLQRAAASLSLNEAAAAAQVAMTLLSDIRIKGKADADLRAQGTPPASGRTAPPASTGGDPWATAPATPPPPTAPPTHTPTPAPGPTPTPTPPTHTPTPTPTPPPTPATNTPAPAPKAPDPGSPNQPPGGRPSGPPQPDRDAVIRDLVAEAERSGQMLDERVLRELANNDPERFDLMVGKVREELAARRKHLGGEKGGQIAEDIAEKTGRGEPETKRRPPDLVDATRKGKVRRSHDTGTEGGRAQAARDGITVDDWDNAEAYEGDFGHGFDDIGRKGGDRYILEYKGESAKLSSSQMSDSWAGNVLARLKVLNDPVADELLEAARAGKLKGGVYTTKVDENGKLVTETKNVSFDGARVEESFETNLPRQRKKKKLPENPSTPSGKPK